jgi:large subunit ribosomal protein L6
MSRIGNNPITIPSGVTFEAKDEGFKIKGPKGELTQAAIQGIDVEVEKGVITVKRRGNSGPERSLHGLTRSLLANAVEGVSNGFTKRLEIVGVGYRAEVKGREIHFALGYSHPIVFPIPPGIEVEVDKQNKITITGCDRQQVGQVAANIRDLRRPDPYKAKGIRYEGEQIRRKVGKAGAK